MLHNLFKTLGIAVLALATVVLMYRYLDVSSGAFSIAVNFSLMFWAALYENRVKPPLNSSYFEAKPFEKQGQFYRYFGVTWFQAILVKSGWEKLRQQNTPIKRGLAELEAYERASRSAELGHIVVAIVVIILTAVVTVTHSLRDARWLIVSNLFLNIYPVLLQRHIRPRLQQLIARYKASRAAVTARR